MATEHCEEMLHWLRENSTTLDMNAIYAMLDCNPYDIKQHALQKLPTDMNDQHFNTSDVLPVKFAMNLDNVPIDMFIKENISPVSSSTEGKIIYVCSFCNKEYKREKFLVKHMQMCYASYVRKMSTPSYSRRKRNSSCYYGNPIPKSRPILSQIQEYSLKMKQFQQQRLREVPGHNQHQQPGQIQQSPMQIQQHPFQNLKKQITIPTQQFPIPMRQFLVPMHQLPFASKEFAIPQHPFPVQMHLSPNQVQLSPTHIQRSPVQDIQPGTLQSHGQALPISYQISPVQILSPPTQILQFDDQTLKYPAEIQELNAQIYPIPGQIQQFPIETQSSLARMQRLHAQIQQQLSTQRQGSHIKLQSSPIQILSPVQGSSSPVQVSSSPVQVPSSPVQIEECFDEIQSPPGEKQQIQQQLQAEKQQPCTPVEPQQQSFLQLLPFQLDFEDLLN